MIAHSTTLAMLQTRAFAVYLTAPYELAADVARIRLAGYRA